MKLFKFNNYIYYTDYEDLRDRPRLAYIKGGRFSLTIDAGHFDNHLNEFYDLLKKNHLTIARINHHYSLGS